MKFVMTATYEDLTKEEIAEIIADNFYSVKSVNDKFKEQLLTASHKREFKNGLRDTGEIMSVLLNLAEDLGLELEE